MRRPQAVLLLAIALSALLACGGGGPNKSEDGGMGGGDPPPMVVVNALTPTGGTTRGGTPLTITGSGFVAPVEVRIGAALATDVVVVDDTMITCTTPPSVPAHVTGQVAVIVDAQGEVGRLDEGFRYATLYGAIGQQGGIAGGSSELFDIDPATGDAEVIGPIGIAMTALAVSPPGVVYGLDVSAANQGIFVVNALTAAPTLVGLLGAPAKIGDLTFLGARLIGHASGHGIYEINLLTGAASLFSPETHTTGQAIAADTVGRVHAVFGGFDPDLYDVDPLTGTATRVGPVTGLTGGAGNEGPMPAITWFLGTLYGIDNHALGPSTTSLVRLDPTTGVATQIGPLPDGMDALAGSRK